MKSKEFEIPVPWGHVAVKAWGDETNQCVLAFHGLGDSAGSFDHIIPFLPSAFYYMCIDLPSHGKSSPYPPYLFISAMDNIFTMRILMNYMKSKKFILMGHSWGGQCLVLFTQLYPEYVAKLILLDAFYFYPVSAEDFKETIGNKIDGLMRVNQHISNNNQPYYTYEEAIEKIRNNRMDNAVLHYKSAVAIANRILIKDGDKYKFSTDPRLKYFINIQCDMKFLVKLLVQYPIRCPLLIVCCNGYQYEYFNSIVEKYKLMKNCTLICVEGDHDIHNNNPEIVGPIVSKFFLANNGKL
ncbi:hypothetical protein FQA39_LY09602 [Lamprigera yunnana]|nr:hypothetical protein FQA39_LY09602 [Lamprigera yunnana]